MAEPIGRPIWPILTEQMGMDIAKQVQLKELRGNLSFDLIGWLSLVAATIYIGITFWPLISNGLLSAWLILQTLTLIGWAVSMFRRNSERLTDSAYMQRWHWHSMAGAVQINALIGVSVWLLLPAAPPQLVDTLIILYCWYILTFSLVSNEGVNRVRWTLWLVGGSLATYLLLYPPHGGRIVAVVVLLMGITSSLLQRLVRQSVVRATIQQIKAEKTQAQLAIALTEVSDQRDARARFMASISHDLQQPLQAAQMLFEIACDPADAKSRGIAEDGREAFASMRNLIEQMLEFMRLSAQRPGAAVRSVVTVDQALSGLRARYRFREGGGVELRWLPCSVQICVNLDHFHRVIGNLLDNALRHADARRILIGARRHAGSIDLWIIDDGVGIPGELRSTLFDPYVRGSKPGAADAGFGLGLASAKVLAEAMGAALSAGPSVGRGASFKLTLPLIDQHPSMPREDLPEPCYAA